MTNVFLSYSRQELYFAESVVKELINNNIDVWFDIQRLTSGIDWKQAIEQGLDNCDAMVFVASHSSLQSPYASHEWGKALDRGKPIYILVFENVSFEPYSYTDPQTGEPREIPLDRLEREATAIIDCRAQFSKNVKRLVYALPSGSSSQKSTSQNLPDQTHTDKFRDRIGKPLPLGFSLKLAHGVSIVAFTLLVATLTMAFATIDIFRPNLLVFLSGVIITILLGSQLMAFLQRRFTYNHIRWTIFLSLLIPGVMTKYPMLGLEILLTLYALFLTFTSKDLLRWSPRGQAPEYLRAGLRLFDRFPQQNSLEPTGKKYIVHFAPADIHIANRVRRVMNRAGFQEGWNQEGVSTDYQLCILSNMSNKLDFPGITSTTDHLIWIVASPLDSTTDYSIFLNRQWVDFRNQDEHILLKMAEELRGDSPTQIVRQLSVNVTPLDFKISIVPGRVSLLTFLFFAIAATIIISFAATLRETYEGSTSDRGFLAFTILFPVVLCFVLVRLNLNIVRRAIGYRRYLLYAIPPLSLVGLILSFAFPPLAVLIVVFCLFLILLPRTWLPTLHPTIVNPTLGRFWTVRLNWEFFNNILPYALMALIAFGFWGNAPSFKTQQVKPENIHYTTVTETTPLSLVVPDHWFRMLISDDDSLNQLTQQIGFAAPIDLVSAEAAGKEPERKSAVVDTLRSETQTGSLGQISKLTWFGLDAPYGEGNSVLMLTVWKAPQGSDLKAFFDAQKGTGSRKGEKVLDENSVDNGTVPCLHLLKPSVGNELHDSEEWYCAVSTQTNVYYLKLVCPTDLLTTERMIVEKVLASVSAGDDQQKTKQ